MSDSVRPHRRQPTRLPRPWDSPGKNSGVGCHFLLQFMKVKSESEVSQSCPTLSDPMDCSPPGFSIHGIFQARVLEWGAIAFSNSPYVQCPTNKASPSHNCLQSFPRNWSVYLKLRGECRSKPASTPAVNAVLLRRHKPGKAEILFFPYRTLESTPTTQAALRDIYSLWPSIFLSKDGTDQ